MFLLRPARLGHELALNDLLAPAGGSRAFEVVRDGMIHPPGAKRGDREDSHRRQS
jgi:hypothetical protein